MPHLIQVLFGSPFCTPPWNSVSPVREELFGIERLEQHAVSLATAQLISGTSPRVVSLQARLKQNAAVLLGAYQASAKELEAGHTVVPAAEWLLDNYHLVEQQIREVKADLPPSFYRQLPKLAGGPFAGYPRVFGLAWAFVAHTDSRFNADNLCRFIQAYQSVQPLTIGELWALAITLRIVLIENLRRLADQFSVERLALADADQLTDRLLVSGCAHSVLAGDIETRSTAPLSEPFAAQLAKRLRDQDPKTTPALEWLEQRLSAQGSTVEEVVQHFQQCQGASNVSIRNVITSMRLISDIDWAELFEQVSLIDERLRKASDYGLMDFATRNLYRSAIEQLARGSAFSELEVAERALQVASEAEKNTQQAQEAQRVGDPGYYLIDQGRRGFERLLEFTPSIGLWISRLHIRIGLGGYIGSILLLAFAMVGGALYGLGFVDLPIEWLVLLMILGLLPATEVSSAIVNRSVTWRLGSRMLAGLELKDGVPESLRTLVAVPTLLTSLHDLTEQVEQLEVHYLGGIDGELSFALLVDGLDADSEFIAGDVPLLTLVAAKIEALNQRYGSVSAGKRFLLLHRRRLFNTSENKWMGWERKRGKLHELNRLLRGATDTSFIALPGETLEVPKNVRYVLTLDADTRLPRDTAQGLIGKMGHPLNRPRFNQQTQRIEAGYGIIQPRVTPSLPLATEGSYYQRVFSSPGGMDPYAAATSDVYQDLFGEGSYTGKGIYDIDAFERSLAGRVADNTLLSHDLFEGVFARAALVSDLEVVEEFPARYDVLAKRQHRWIRGDWQLLPWIVGGFSALSGVSWIGRWKMLDNLRRSLVGPLTFVALLVSWLLPLPLAIISSTLLLATLIIPAFMPCIFSLTLPVDKVNVAHHLRRWLGDLRLASAQVLFNLTFLPDHSWRTLDAIGRTLLRVFITHRRLLEWTSTAQSNGHPRLSLLGFYQTMLTGTLLSQLLCLAILSYAPTAWPLVLPFALLWLSAPLLAFCSSRSRKYVYPQDIEQYANPLRFTARRTWRYFETFVTAEDNMLPPDNFQQDPLPVIAHRTSPTNIGLYFLSAVAARDFGWAGLQQTVERLEASFLTLDKLARHKGHFYNWYSTQSLQTLVPAYVSSVDSGNFAGHLIALANALDEWSQQPVIKNNKTGVHDNLWLLDEAILRETNSNPAKTQLLTGLVSEINKQLMGSQSIEVSAPIVIRLCEKAARLANEPKSTGGYDEVSDVCFWFAATANLVAELWRDQQLQLASNTALTDFSQRLAHLAKRARLMANGMDFAFLIDPQRKLMSIGYSVTENSLDPSCYDLLASEARLASLFAIAKGDVATKHWFRLGRTATPLGNGSALISWSGSMFEYLMPSLVMRAPIGSLLEQTNRLVVERQQRYAHQLGIPWGMSESAYNARDIEFTYQYSNFGVPGLGLKRGLSENRVIAPYATGLAAMIDPMAAFKNYQRLEKMGACGRFGFYEALDFSPARLPSDSTVALVASFMAHHQGMTIVAILNCLQHGVMRSRFHREPSIQACELLLQERMPRDVAIGHPRAEEVKGSVSVSSAEANTVRRVKALSDGSPITHLLSNGRYTVMLTSSGAGYSRWGEFAITRWQEDSTCDDKGSFILLRDVESGQRWAATAQPLGCQGVFEPSLFAEDHAEFSMSQGSLNTKMEVLVSGEDDGEVRRLSVTNNGAVAREVELSSYAELVLATPAADNAHPAFAKMFVQTEFIPEFGALVAMRRKRSAQDSDIWVAHFAIVEGEISADPQYETSRAEFIGRGNTIAGAVAMKMGQTSKPLSNTVGCVLDPIFALRYQLNVPPGELVRVAYWTVVASSRIKLIEMIDRHNDLSAYDRAKTLAWTQAQVQLRHLGIKDAEVADFQRLAAPLIYSDPRFRASSSSILRGMAAQSELWPHAISGDSPIVVLRIDEIADLAQVKQLLRAHEYWCMKGLVVDLVIINEHPASYVQDLQNALDTAVRSSQSRPRFHNEFATDKNKCAVYVLRADLVSTQIRELLNAVARVVLVARHGQINKQITRLTKLAVKAVGNSALYHRQIKVEPISPPGVPQIQLPELEFFNGLGGFAANGTEYVICLNKGQQTPAPWINVIANPVFGFHVSAEGSGYTWSENSRENQLTAWSNDAVSDPAGEIIYIRDEDSHQLYTATAQPIQDSGRYITQHGFGYSRFTHQVDGLLLELLQYVPLNDPLKISRLSITNYSGRPRKLSVTAYTEWVLGTTRNHSAPFISTALDPDSKAILLRNRWGMAFTDRVAFVDMAGKQTSWTTDRREFIGRNGHKSAPAALLGSVPLSGVVGAGHDPCSAMQQPLELAAGESVECVVLMGQSDNQESALALIQRYRETDLAAVFIEVKQHWHGLLNKVQVTTPDRSMDILLNGWLLYQTLACRIWARSSFYQASGAYGFRDQLQDGMALSFSRPDITRAHILRAAARQFVEGDVQHWWLPHTGQGVRTYISDDRVWLALATANYINSAADNSILNERVPFLEGPLLKADQHDAFFRPMLADESASLYEHCARGLDQAMQLTGELGLPLMGTGDWNDGMNLVGAKGKGESVWLAWLLVHTIDVFVVFAMQRGSEKERLRGKRWQAHATRVRHNIDEHAWDGQWYRRATFDDGSWLGAKDNDECKIDSIAQSWAVLAGAKDTQRVAMAMAQVEKQLILREQGLALLFTPPFDHSDNNPGYIQGYPPGLRENGGQYSHAAMWLIFAFSKLDEGKKATDLFSMLNPINHARTAQDTARYKVEPYVVAADIYSVEPYSGRGGWTWYTGAAGWMYRAGIEGILGIRRRGKTLLIQPCIPAQWPEFSASIEVDNSAFDIKVINQPPLATNLLHAELDGVVLGNPQQQVAVELDGSKHVLIIRACSP